MSFLYEERCLFFDNKHHLIHSVTIWLGFFLSGTVLVTEKNLQVEERISKGDDRRGKRMLLNLGN